MLLSPIEIEPVSGGELNRLGGFQDRPALEAMHNRISRNRMIRDFLSGTKHKLHRFEGIGLYQCRGLRIVIRDHRGEVNRFSGTGMMKGHHLRPGGSVVVGSRVSASTRGKGRPASCGIDGHSAAPSNESRPWDIARLLRIPFLITRALPRGTLG